MGLIKEFQEFAVKGNAVDMAVGIIIGGAFGKIVNSLVADVIMPPLGFLIGGDEFSKLALVLQEATGDEPEVALRYGMFLTTVLDFLIIAFSIFLVIKAMNSLRNKKKEEGEGKKA